ncbi:sodium:proton antiporter NhaD [Methylocaldum marinum]|nr:sodium:proton antiporter NhaD [Methylocaldum marinum]
MLKVPLASLLMVFPLAVPASPAEVQALDLTGHWVGYLSIAAFVLAYIFVVLEEVTELKKSKPMMLAAAVIWAAIAVVYNQHGEPRLAEDAVRTLVLDYGELLLFLIVSITYVNALEERQVFEAVRAWLVSKGLGYRSLFWITGILAFFISSISNNMTTAMLMTAVVMAVGKDNPRFVALSCVNTVVAVNAGGAFCPFGDITTLMVWQQHKITFWGFFVLFIPSVINFVLPAAIMHFAIPVARPAEIKDVTKMKRGAKRIIALFLLTIATAVVFSNVLHLPAAVGMMAGLTYIQFFGYFLHITHRGEPSVPTELMERREEEEEAHPGEERFDIFQKLAQLEWDTLLFFYGVVLCVGGLDFLGYLSRASQFLYGELGATPANILVGIASAFVDNIPVMFAILSMNPDISTGQWLLVTLTAGVGGSLLSVGSAAGVALMGQTRGAYTFLSHLKWMPVIALGYAGSIAAHFWLNADLF